MDPKADGGSNHLDNRALLCKPCNGTKGNRLTMSALRRQNTKDGHLTKPAGTPRSQDGHPLGLPTARQNCREALERHHQGQPMQLVGTIAVHDRGTPPRPTSPETKKPSTQPHP